MRKKPVIRVDKNTNTLRAYESVTDAAKDISGQESHISECINKKRRTHKGYEWE